MFRNPIDLLEVSEEYGKNKPSTPQPKDVCRQAKLTLEAAEVCTNTKKRFTNSEETLVHMADFSLSGGCFLLV